MQKRLYGLLLLAFLVSCSPQLYVQATNDQQCLSKGGYWYKQKCWADYQDDRISKSTISNFVDDALGQIEKSFIQVNGNSYQLDFVFPETDDQQIILMHSFAEKHNLYLYLEQDLEMLEERQQVEAQYIVESTNDSLANDVVIVAEGKLTLQVNEQFDIKIVGTLTSDNGQNFQINAFYPEVIFGAGNSKLTVKDGKAYLSGTLGSKAYRQLEELIANQPKINEIVFTQIDGSINDSVNLHTGYLLRKHNYNTTVMADSMIASGGVDLFLAGKKRKVHKGAKIGVHSWCCLLNMPVEESPNDHPAHQDQLEYVTSMLGDIGKEFYFFTLQAAPASEIYYMNDTEVKRLRVSTEFID